MESKFCNLDVAAAMKLKILAANVDVGGKYIGKKTDTSSLLRIKFEEIISCLFLRIYNFMRIPTIWFFQIYLRFNVSLQFEQSKEKLNESQWKNEIIVSFQKSLFF